MVGRYQEFLSVLGSLRLEGAEPSPEVVALGERWARGELTADELAAAAPRIAAGVPPTEEAVVGDPEPPRADA